MQEKALNEAKGSLRRVADLLTSTSTEPQGLSGSHCLKPRSSKLL